MMQKLERRVCECCGQNEFKQLDPNHIKCVYCDTVYFTGSYHPEEDHSDIESYCKVDAKAAAEAVELAKQHFVENMMYQRMLDEAKEKRAEYKRKKRNSLLIHLFLFFMIGPMLTCTNVPDVGFAVMVISIVNLFVRQHHYNKFYLPYLDTCAKYNL